MAIRPARREDVPRLLEIYNYEVLSGVATLDITPRTIDEWELWFLEHAGNPHHPIFVYEQEGGTILGYSSLSEFRKKEAYRSSCELSVYIAPEGRGKGIGTLLLEKALSHARNDPDMSLVVSVITSGNKVSEHLHRKFSFTWCGRIEDVGMKNGILQSVDFYSLKV